MGNIVNFNKPSELDDLWDEITELRDKVKHMTVFVTYKDESVDVFHDEQLISHLCLTEKVLGSYIEELLH